MIYKHNIHKGINTSNNEIAKSLKMETKKIIRVVTDGFPMESDPQQGQATRYYADGTSHTYDTDDDSFFRWVKKMGFVRLSRCEWLAADSSPQIITKWLM